MMHVINSMRRWFHDNECSSHDQLIIEIDERYRDQEKRLSRVEEIVSTLQIAGPAPAQSSRDNVIL